MRTSDVAVIGAGIVGLSTAHALRERGASVTVFERATPGDAQSGGASRIFRHAHDDPRLVAFARESRAVWREWEARFGAEMISGDGAIAIGPRVAPRMRAIDEAGGVAARIVDGAELAGRMPLLAGHEGPALLDEAGGAIRTRAAVTALAGSIGDALVREEVVSLAQQGDAVRIDAAGRTSVHGRAIVCAGRETARFARAVGCEIPVALSAHLRLTFAVAGAPPARLACLQDGTGRFGEPAVYGAPMPGNARFGLGVSTSVPAREDGALLDPAAPAALARRAAAYVGRALPGLRPEPVGARNCWVTELPWGPDGLAVWEQGPVLLVAGHNLFKQAPGLGRALAAAAAGDGLPDVLRPEARLGASADVANA